MDAERREEEKCGGANKTGNNNARDISTVRLGDIQKEPRRRMYDGSIMIHESEKIQSVDDGG